MKKSVVILLAFLLSLSLFACKSENESNIVESLTEKIAETIIETVTESSYDVEIISSDNTSLTVTLSQKEAEEIAHIIENSSKTKEEVNPDCLVNYRITVNGKEYAYHSDCGTLQRKQNSDYIIIRLDDREKEKLNSIINTNIAAIDYCRPEPTDTTKISADTVEDLSAVFEPVSGTPLRSTVAAADFGFRLFKESLKDEKNALISPTSVITALTMAANGAKGDTLKEIENMLGMKLETLNSAFAKSKVIGEGVKTANSIWIRKNIALNVSPEFININQKNFGAEVFNEKFDSNTVKKINGWVDKNTDGMIKNMLDEIPDDAVMYLINTVLFDAEWEFKYTSDNVIKNQTFTSESGKKQTVEMLYNEDATTGFMNFKLGKTDVVLKDYTNGYSFAAMLPNEGVSVNDAISSFTGSDFVNAVTKRINSEQTYGIHYLKTWIPKFEFECSFDFTETLKKLGMPTAFSSSKADFTNMATSPAGNIYIGKVGHNTHIVFDENGTKAGAATYVEMKCESVAEPPNYRELRFDRPFIYVIFEKQTGMPLFIGTVREF